METFTMKEIEMMLAMEEVMSEINNHEVFYHSLPDNGALILGIVNTILILYLIYKQNTNK